MEPVKIDAKPLSEEEVEELKKRIANANPDKINSIYNTHRQYINGLIQMAMKQTTEDDEIVEIERLKRIINLCPIEEIFLRSKDKIWGVRSHILNKNADYFINKDYGSLIKRDHNQTFIETIVSIIRHKFKALPEDDQNKYWNSATQLLRNVAEYKKLVCEK